VILELGRICDPGVDQGATPTGILRSETHERGSGIERHQLDRLLDPDVGVVVVLASIRFPDRRGTGVGSRPLPMSDAWASSIFGHL